MLEITRACAGTRVPALRYLQYWRAGTRACIPLCARAHRAARALCVARAPARARRTARDEDGDDDDDEDGDVDARVSAPTR